MPESARWQRSSSRSRKWSRRDRDRTGSADGGPAAGGDDRQHGHRAAGGGLPVPRQRLPIAEQRRGGEVVTAARSLAAVLALAVASATPTRAMTLSAVFAGDPINPATGLPYEILPGQPLVMPGPDRRLGTADDVIDRTIVGDIDL